MKPTSKRRSAARPTKAGAPAVASGSFVVVGIGASAGGLEAFTELLRHLPVDTGMSFVVVQHLDPSHQSLLPQLLASITAMPVHEATEGMRVEPNRVYVIPANRSMVLAKGVLKLQPRTPRGHHRTIDLFFESLAEDRHGRAIGIVLSGNAADGTVGLEAIKAEGGITFAQDCTAKNDSMPRSAEAAGCVDFVLSPAGVAAELVRIAKHPYVLQPVVPEGADRNTNVPDAAKPDAASHRAPLGRDTAAASAGEHLAVAKAEYDEEAFAKILGVLHAHAGVDFALYKPNTIHRRIARRIVLGAHEAMAPYAESLPGNPKEIGALYSDLLIGVTSFFRNPDAFETLKRVVFPKIVLARGSDPMRIWTLACSTGQEAYSIAMAFLEFCDGLTGPAPKLQMFATDLNEAALEKARGGLYANVAADMSPARLKRFFVEESGGHRVNKTLREMCIFARQNVVSDPPFSRMDLISCRNLMIYLEAEVQQQMLPAFHYALRDRGFLFLGASETVGAFTHLFSPTDKKHRIYTKKPGPTPALKLRFAPRHPAMKAEAGRAPGPLIHGELDAQREADRVTLNRHAPPGVLVDANLQIIQFRGSTGRFLEPMAGRASYHLLKMAREDLVLPLRSALTRAKRENVTVRRDNILLAREGQIERVAIEVIPLKNLRERFYLIWFETPARRLGLPAPAASVAPAATGRPVKGRRSRDPLQRVAALERELEETREYLRSMREDHDNATQEVQAASEEVQSANEELQSLNEELETSKEELVSSFEELTTLHEETTHRNAELNRLNADLNNLHVSVNTAILVLGADLSIRRFTPQAAKLFNLLPGDAGRNIESIRHALSLPDLSGFVAEVMASGIARECEVTDKGGRWYLLRGRPYVTADEKIDGAVLVLVDIDNLRRTQDALRVSELYFRTLTQSLSDIVWTAQPDGQVDFVNARWLDYTGQELLSVLSSRDSWITTVHPEDRERVARISEEGFRTGKGSSIELRLRRADGQYRWFLSRTLPLNDGQGRLIKFIGTATDIDDMKLAQSLVAEHTTTLEMAVVERTAALRETLGELEALSYGVAHDMRAPLRAMRGFADLLLAGHASSLDADGLVFLHRIAAAAQRMDRLIDDVLTYTRVLRSDFRTHPVDVEAMLRGIIESYPQFDPTNAEIAIVGRMPLVLAHDASLGQCFSNLLSNAVKFVAPGTRPRIKISAEERGADVRIWIEDNGVGIDPRNHERIFNIFERISSEETYPGTGIGLAVVRKAVERLKGQVGVESALGEGSRFWIQLPKANSA